jgi:hypothetical protein
VPTIAEVAGFLIVMYWKDHDPPHFHVMGNGSFAKIDLETLSIIDVKGTLKANEIRAIRAWAHRHLPALHRAWRQAQRGERPDRIEG